jgi:hypothetical protein
MVMVIFSLLYELLQISTHVVEPFLVFALLSYPLF